MIEDFIAELILIDFDYHLAVHVNIKGADVASGLTIDHGELD